MQKVAVFIAIMILSLSGCTSINVPKYIKDENPYRQKFYSNYEVVLTATLDVLRNYGWAIDNRSDPALFERSMVMDDPNGRQTLIFTEARENSLVVGTKFARINVYVRSDGANVTEVELRYLKVTSLNFKNFYDYKDDKLAQKIFDDIEELLN